MIVGGRRSSAVLGQCELQRRRRGHSAALVARGGREGMYVRSWLPGQGLIYDVYLESTRCRTSEDGYK